MGRVSSKRKGIEFERDILGKFAAKGFLVVRSARSKDPCDLIAIPTKKNLDQRPICIQCKMREIGVYLTKEERKELLKLKEIYSIRVVVAKRYKKGKRWVTEFEEL